MGVCFLNVSQAHMWEAEKEQRALRPRRAARAGGVPARIEERLDSFEAPL
jgi:hypothetical protein